MNELELIQKLERVAAEIALLQNLLALVLLSLPEDPDNEPEEKAA